MALLSKAILPRQIGVEDLGEILELVKNEAGGVESKYQFVDVREEEELKMAKLDGESRLRDVNTSCSTCAASALRFSLCFMFIQGEGFFLFALGLVFASWGRGCCNVR